MTADHEQTGIAMAHDRASAYSLPDSAEANASSCSSCVLAGARFTDKHPVGQAAASRKALAPLSGFPAMVDNGVDTLAYWHHGGPESMSIEIDGRYVRRRCRRETGRIPTASLVALSNQFAGRNGVSGHARFGWRSFALASALAGDRQRPGLALREVYG